MEKDIIVNKRTGPGRPRNSEKILVPLARIGVVDKPSKIEEGNREIVFELIYDKPLVFKKIFTIIKQLKTTDLRFKVQATCMKIYAVSPNKNSEVYIQIFGERMNSYHSRGEYEFQIKHEKISKIVSAIDRNHTQIQFVFTRANLGTKLGIILINDIIHEEDNYQVDTNGMEFYDWSVENDLALEDEYALKFDMNYNTFKRKISESKNVSNVLRIEKLPGDDTLYMHLTFTDGGVDKVTEYRDSQAINLRSNLQETSMLGVSVYLDRVKPLLSGSQIPETITISVDDNKPKMIFSIPLDFSMNGKLRRHGTNSCEIKMLVNTVNARDDEPVEIIKTVKQRKPRKPRGAMLVPQEAPEIIDDNIKITNEDEVESDD